MEEKHMGWRDKKISNSANPASRGDFSIQAETAKIQEEIDAEAKKIDGAYARIGRAYADQDRQACRAQYPDQMQLIEASSKAVQALRLQIQLIKGIVACPKCGFEAPKGSIYCSQCATKLPVIDFGNYTRCPKCGKMTEKNAEQCFFCRTPLKKEDPAGRCSKCGRELEPGARFCAYCRTPVAFGDFQPAAPQGVVCPGCGKVDNQGNRFCTECGRPLT